MEEFMVPIINGIEAREYRLSYDKIIKNTLSQSNEMTIRFVNGLFGDDIPLDAGVAWLDKESVNDKHAGFIADFYPQIAGRMYHIEVEQDDNGDMAVRVFKYTVGGAILHGMSATDAELSVTFPQPCVIFLKSGEHTPKSLKWNINFFDGQKVTLQIPTIRLAEMSVEEIAGRNLLPIGQFYMRTFEPLTKNKVEGFRAAAASLLTALKNAVDQKTVPYHIGMQMQETIRMTVENTVSRSGKEVDLFMEANIVETLPWIDFGEVLAKLEERSKAEGKEEGIAEGIAKRDMEIAIKAFNRMAKGVSPAVISQSLLDLGIPENIIEAARVQVEAELAQNKKRNVPAQER
jgi:hypothetical protein